ncbi:hypothetical protein M2137_002085 [Parabacteroides sp. PFB2-10]|uniref:hypothetical protein n=1 Tax=Parabacteroides sp. PFB2-10 TaxID=1742405 RepID=UPI002476EF42|nr:hypothetical protein [Parabacteroides sp. PFB2-10]MDH6313295.1 hypothetical protein [Parabacteroides sp. PFB2-10]
MKRLSVYIVVLFFMTVNRAWGDGSEAKNELVKEMAPVVIESASVAGDSTRVTPAEAFLKAYSMNSLLMIETNQIETIYIYDSTGALHLEHTPTSTFSAIPISRGEYTVKTEHLSQEVVVK